VSRAPAALIPRAPGLRPLLVAEIVSTTGAAMTAIALPWLVLSTTGSPARAGLVAAVEWLPMALLGIPSGSLAARLGPRRTMILCDAARVPVVAAIPALHWLGALDLAPLLVLAFLVGAFFPAHLASQRIILPELLGEGTGEVTRGNAVMGAANRLPLVLGPALGGALIAAVGPAEVLLADAATYGVSALLLIAFVPERAAGTTAPEDAGDLWAGARSLAASAVLRPLTLANAGIELAMQALFLAVPILVFTEYDGRAAVAGALMAAWGAGALAGTVLALRLASKPPLTLVRTAMLAQSLPLLIVATPLSPPALAAGMLVSGLANPVVNAPSFTLVTLSVPPPVRARAMLAFLTAALTAGGAGLFLTGPAAEAVGARQVILGAALLSIACAAGFALSHGARRSDIVAHAITDPASEGPMQLDGIHHITAITADAHRNVDFYARVLGLRLVKKSVNQDDPTVYHLFYGDEHAHPGLDLTFFEYPGAAPGRPGEGMIHRVVWRVGGEDALDFWASRLAGEGIETRRDGAGLHFADPEGLEHELLVTDVRDEPLTAEHPEVPAEHALQGFHAVRAYASDPERSRGLLEALGFEETDSTWEARGPRRGGLYLYDSPPAERGIQGAGTVHHIAWASEDEDHEAWRGRVQQGGGRPTPVIDRHYFRSIYFREPSGVLFEIATRSPGFTVDEPLETLGEKLSIPPFLEHRRPEIEATVRPLENPRAVTS
jgi:glyoxalase family protein